jgi:hypothetical protein
MFKYDKQHGECSQNNHQFIKDYISSYGHYCVKVNLMTCSAINTGWTKSSKTTI